MQIIITFYPRNYGFTYTLNMSDFIMQIEFITIKLIPAFFTFLIIL